jgi:copper(I)-binding protein
MTTPKITIHDAITKQTVTRDMNSAELAQLEADKVADDARVKAESDAKAANDAKVLSAKNKLKALGLTDAEVTALVG